MMPRTYERVRSIPAGTGKPADHRSVPRAPGVDPRGHGEARTPLDWRCRRTGRSPRARGSPRKPGVREPRRGSIPAGTGKPCHQVADGGVDRVDPRGHGEAAGDPALAARDVGRSPRARGSPLPNPQVVAFIGSIPAGTGKPTNDRSRNGCSRVDPRGHGEASRTSNDASAPWGRSPRARGSPDAGGKEGERAGSIPAGTGKPRHQGIHVRHEGVDPRGHGEARSSPFIIRPKKGRSPRARGSQEAGWWVRSDIGSIPAGTGKPRGDRPRSGTWRVDPRGHGEASNPRALSMSAEGRSPRARGSPSGMAIRYRRCGSIPAGTGKPHREPAGVGVEGVDPRGHGEAGPRRS